MQTRLKPFATDYLILAGLKRGPRPTSFHPRAGFLRHEGGAVAVSSSRELGSARWHGRNTQGLIDLFTESLPDVPWVERRKMFGYPVVFVGGNMCAGLFADRVFARLSPADWAALPGGGDYFEPTPGRPMKRYAILPEVVVAEEGVGGRPGGGLYRLPPKAKKRR